MKRGSVSWANLGPTHPEEIWPLRVDAGVHAGRASYAVLPGVRRVSKTRLGDQLSMVDDECVRRIDGALAAYLYE